MAIRHISIKNFRSLKSFDWSGISPALNCLLGPGDAGKTSVLQAIELTLNSRWNPPVSDALFYSGDASNPITIEVTLDTIPKALIRESKFGLYLRGWSESKGVMDNPDDGHTAVLTVRFAIDHTLEPTWRVVSTSSPEGVAITAQDRALFGVLLIDGVFDEQFIWSKRSLVSSLTGDDDKLGTVLAEIRRHARASFDAAKVPSLVQSSLEIQKLAVSKGIGISSAYAPHLELATNRLGAIVSLHDGNVPVSALGAGSRRLLAIAMQQASKGTPGILLLDEVETGLEPYRLRSLVRELKEKPDVQSFVTTHSPVVVNELSHGSTFVVRRAVDKTSALSVSEDLNRVLKSVPEAILANRILICEGKTEMGFVSGIDDAAGDGGERSLLYRGISLVDGSGSQTLARAQEFIRFGCNVCVLMDSDESKEEKRKAEEQLATELMNAGATVIRWSGRACIEERIFADVMQSVLNELIAMCIDEWGLERIKKDLIEFGGLKANSLSENYQEWQTAFATNQLYRQCLGRASKKREWFKRFDLGERLGRCVHIENVIGNKHELAAGIDQLIAWMHGN